MKKCNTLHLLILISLIITSCTSTTVANSLTDTPSETSYLKEANTLKELGIIKGSDLGFEFHRQPSRIEGLVVMMRLFDLEKNIDLNSNLKSSFTDVPYWAIPYSEYGLEKGIVNGVGNNKFASSDSLSANQFLAFCLRNIGQVDAGDTSIDQMSSLALDLGFIDRDTFTLLTNSTFTRELLIHVAYQFYNNDIKDHYNTFILTTYFVDSQTGSNSNNGSFSQPFKTIQYAFNRLKAGDILRINKGIYYESLILSASGTPDKPISIYGQPSSKVIIDGIKFDVSYDNDDNKPLMTYESGSDYINLSNLDFLNSPSNGINIIESSHNNFYNINSSDHNGSGFMSGGSYNSFYSCVASNNYDYTYSGQHGDGFTFDTYEGYGYDNQLIDCISYSNSDDGYDTWGAQATLFKNCLAYYNGSEEGNRNRDFIDNNFEGNGNGFKLGIGIDNLSQSIVDNCLAYENLNAGFTTNDGSGNIITNSTAINNYGSGRDDRQFFIWMGPNDGEPNKITHSVAYPNEVSIDNNSHSDSNSWELSSKLSSSDFISLTTTSSDFSKLNPSRTFGSILTDNSLSTSTIGYVNPDTQSYDLFDFIK